MKIYTKKGDGGQTTLTGGARVDKDDAQVEAVGAMDELNAHLGLLSAMVADATLRQWLGDIQATLFRIGSGLGVSPDSVTRLEQLIDRLSPGLPVQQGFVVPGGCVQSAQCHVCRTVCRRAERRLVTLSHQRQVPGGTLGYVNRLSDFLFVLARKLSFIYHTEEKTWQIPCR